MIEQIHTSLNKCSLELQSITGRKVEVFYKYHEEKRPLEYLVNVVCGVCNVTFEDLVREDRNPTVVCARHIFFYLSVKVEGYTRTRVARLLNRHHTTVIYALRHVGNMLDINDPQYSSFYWSIIKLVYETRSTA